MEPSLSKGATLDLATAYTKRGWSLVPVPYKTKKPILNAWQMLRLKESDLPQHFNGAPQNIGMLTGEPSSWIVDVDLDHMRAVELADQFLPPTPAIFGRPGKPRSHRLYRVKSPIATKKHQSKSAGMIVELRSTGCQTVLPPSVHPSGELIQWEVDGAEPAEIEPEVLIEAVKKLGDTVKIELGEKATKPEPKKEKPKRETKANAEPPKGSAARCLAVMNRFNHKDHKDGSFRLYYCACRCIEHDLDDETAVDTINTYAKDKPFAKDWTDSEILQRIRHAEYRVKRGAALETEHDGCVKLGNRDPDTGKLVLSPRRTLPTAEAFVREFHDDPFGQTLRCFAGVFYQWKNNRYVEVEDGALKQRLQPWLHGSVRYVYNKSTKENELVPFESNPGSINGALESIRAYTHLPATTVAPSWLSGNSAFEAKDILPCRSKLLHLPTMKSIVPTPDYFTFNALEFDPDPKAPLPVEWLKFLNDVFGDDLESIQLLQEYIGYCLTGDTSQQKMMLMVGPKRSGKGTIARVLNKLVGEGNVCGPTTGSLAGPFGLQSLIGKSLAIVSDARFHGDNISTVVERLLCISGEDAITVERKFLGGVTMKLPTRFMFLTNELPRFTDSSGALAGRFLILQTQKSFYGKEDVGLTDRLLTELPGILNWAMEGLHRLRQRRHFLPPQSSSDTVQEIEDLASPVGAFVRECCDVGPGFRVYVDHLYGLYKDRCALDGRTNLPTIQNFSRDLKAVVPGLITRRDPKRFFEGIQTKAPF